eukprot:UN03762
MVHKQHFLLVVIITIKSFLDFFTLATDKNLFVQQVYYTLNKKNEKQQSNTVNIETDPKDIVLLLKEAENHLSITKFITQPEFKPTKPLPMIQINCESNITINNNNVHHVVTTFDKNNNQNQPSLSSIFSSFYYSSPKN